MLKCSCAHTLSSLFMYCSFAIIGHADIIWSIVSSNCWQSLHLLSVSVFNILLLLLFKPHASLSFGPGSVVGIATGYELGSPGIESRWGRDFPHLSRPALGPTQPPIQWVPGLSRSKDRPERDADPTPPSSAVVKKE